MEEVKITIEKYITEDEVVEIIKDLVRIPSYPGIKNQETKVAEYFHKLFLKEGIDSEVIEVIDGRCNIVARLKGKGTGKTLLLTGHTDTVPPYDMEKALSPYIQDNKIYGRGTVDMKGPLACMAAAIIGIKRSGEILSGDVIFAGVIDEEHKSEGTIDLIKRGIKADAAIVGEPTNFSICVAHRGLEWLEFHFKGKAVHGGAQHDGKNAIAMASDFIVRINELIPKYIENCKHSIIGSGSYNLGTIVGGTQPSTVAGDCVITLDRRWLPGEKYLDVMGQFKKILEELKEIDDTFECEMKVMDISVMSDGFVHEAMEIDLNHEIIDIVAKKGKEILNIKLNNSFFPAWSDGGLISSYSNIPTIVFAPGNLESAHTSTEYIEVNQVYSSVKIYSEVIREYCR